MRKVIFGITNLNLGGAERVLVDICNKLCKKYDITILTIYPHGEFEKELKKEIHVKSIYDYKYEEVSKSKRILSVIKLFILKRMYFNKYVKNKFDVEIAFLEGPITNLFSVGDKTEKVAWIHNDISLVFGSSFKAKIKKIMNKRVYEKYDQLVFVSQDNLKKFEQTYNIEVPTNVIYNYIDIQTILEKAKETISLDNSIINFLSVARLVEQKGIDRLIDVHKRLIQEGLEHRIYIVGDGPLKESLTEKIKSLNLQNTFILLGKKENPYPYIQACTYFCLLSHFEGYGMVLEEAKILGKPIIITDTAAREAVSDYKNAKILKNSFDGIYDGLKEIIFNNREYVIEKEDYDNEYIIEQIEQILK